jgi:serine protease Do
MRHKIGELTLAAIGVLVLTSGVLLAQKTEHQDPTAGMMMHGFGSQSWMGVSVSDVTSDVARGLKLSGDYGALVSEVKPGSPAAKSGVQKNDVIIEFDGERVRSVAELRRLVRETPSGRTVKIKLIRDGQARTLAVALESQHGMPESMRMPDITIPEIRIPAFNLNFSRRGRLGISAQELTSQLADYFGVKQGKGVLVLEVRAGSPGEKAGLKAGDCIVKIDDKEVDSVWALQNALNGRPAENSGEKQKHNLTIIRDHHEQTVTVQLDAQRAPVSKETGEAAAPGEAPQPPQIALPDLDTLNKEIAQLQAQTSEYIQERSEAIQTLKQRMHDQLRQIQTAKQEAVRKALDSERHMMEMEKQDDLQRQYQQLMKHLAFEHGAV